MIDKRDCYQYCEDAHGFEDGLRSRRGLGLYLLLVLVYMVID